VSGVAVALQGDAGALRATSENEKIMSNAHRTIFGLLVAIASLACGASDEDPATPAGAGGSVSSNGGAGSGGETAGGGGETTGSAGSAGTPAGGAGGAPFTGPTIKVYGTTRKYLAGSTSYPVLPGVEVCVHTHPELPCATSDSLGDYTLSAPAEAEIALHFVKEGFMSALAPWTTGKDDQKTDWDLVPQTLASAVAGAVGATWPPPDGKGYFVFYLTAPTAGGTMGATASISPASGVGPYYYDKTGLPDTSLTSVAEGKGGLFVEVDAGEVDVSIQHPGLICNGGPRHWASATASGRVPVASGFLTVISLKCSL
jgi:hypothetical protein